MNLKEFITTTLVEIAEGVKDAQKQYQSFGGAVNPCGLTHSKNGPSLYDYINRPGSKDFSFHMSNIEFEIALTDNAGSEGKSGLGVFFGSIGLGGEY